MYFSRAHFNSNVNLRNKTSLSLLTIIKSLLLLLISKDKSFIPKEISSFPKEMFFLFPIESTKVLYSSSFPNNFIVI
ncbi:hypothetical protein BB2000_2429 [Proteus mirabilis BB2000]|nr:hypothetical protein BB2000_2429 [Proteus mirabilis BB2000]